MKKTSHISIILAIILLSGAFITSAQTSFGTNSTTTIREKIRRDIANHVQNARNNVDYRNRILENARSQQNFNPAQFISLRNRAEMQAIANLRQIAERIQGRIAKLAQDGKDVTLANSLLSIASDNIDIAQSPIQSFASSTPAHFSSTTDPIVIREQIKNNNDLVKTAQESLNAVVVEIAHLMGVKLESTTATSNSTN